MSQFFINESNPQVPDIETLTGNTGGAVGADANSNVNILGAGGLTVVGTPGSNTLTITSSGSGFVWNNVSGTSSSMSPDNGYVANNAGLVTLTLPVTAAFGTAIAIQGFGAGGFIVAQNAGQNIQFGSTSTTIGAGGSLASTNQYDSLQLLCVVANTTWTVLGGPQGTLTPA